ncbi:MAG: glycosyltransferase, partial [Chitinivibrionales bacterium]|nr:glycosyltransferase [Chitinivibrionales bacterium]
MESHLRILYISNEYPPQTGFGGIATYTKTIAEIMAERGHAVQVLARSPEGVTFIETVNGVTVHRISAGTYRLPEGKLAYPLRRVCRSAFPHTLAYRA